MVGGGWLAHLATYILTHLSISFLLSSHSSPLAPIPSLKPMGGSDNGPKALRLVEFQTPTVFDCDFNSHHSLFYWPPKIMKIILYILYVHKNVSTILI
jgi:hypothetical protein